MQEQKNIIDCYNKVARKYTDAFLNELEEKHLDQILLKAFSEQNAHKGRFVDLGCGPGQTTRFLFETGCNILGTDLSPEMVKIAGQHHPQISFGQADMLQLKYPDRSFAAALAFYSIVNFDYQQVQIALTEIKRVLIDRGELLFSFHAGNETIHLDEFLGQEVTIKFQQFDPARIRAIVIELEFEVVDLIRRQPYPHEHQTERAYFWIKKLQ